MITELVNSIFIIHLVTQAMLSWTNRLQAVELGSYCTINIVFSTHSHIRDEESQNKIFKV
jgi:hypothetical protein